MRTRDIVALAVIGSLLVIVLVGIFTNLSGFHSFTGQLHDAVTTVAMGLWDGVILLFVVGVLLGGAYVVIRLRQMSKVQVVGPGRHGHAQQALIIREAKGVQRVEHLNSPLVDPMQQMKMLEQIMKVASATTMTDQRMFAMMQKMNAIDAPRQQLPEAAESKVVDAIPEVVSYEDIADEVPENMSLLGIYPKNGNLEIVTPERYKTTWFVGGSNTGKTNTVYGKVADMVRWGAGIIICDNHAIKKDSLAKKLADFHHRLICPIAQEPVDIKDAIIGFLAEFRARKSGKKSCDDLWLIVSDEVNATSKLPVKISDDEKQMLLEVYGIKIDGNVTTLRVFFQLLAETCGYEARGFNMFGFFISQKVAHLSWLRNAMMTVFVHGLLMDSEALLAANNDRKMADLVKAFKKGRTLVYGYEFDPVILQQPLYGEPKNDHPVNYPGGETYTDPLLPADLPQTSKLNNLDNREGNGEAAGSEDTENQAPTDLSTIKQLREIGKRLKNGEDPAKIVKSYGLPYGRGTQELSAVVNMMAWQIDAEIAQREEEL